MSKYLGGIIGGCILSLAFVEPAAVQAVPAVNEITPQVPRVLPERAAPVPPVTLPTPPEKAPEKEPQRPAALPDTAPAKGTETQDMPDSATPHPENKAADAPEILDDINALPEPVRRMRQRILDAALSGDAEKLRTAIEVNEMPPAFSFAEEGDPIAALKKESYDGEGREILAILAEVMEARFVHVDKGTPQEMYVWPYFAQYPIDKLDPAQTVELFRIMTAFEFSEMKEFGAYNFYRVGISPDGVWHFMVSGD